MTTSTTREPIAVLTQANLKKIGIDVQIEKVPGAEWYTRLNKKDMPLLLMSFKAWLNYPDYYFYWTYDGINNSVFDDMNYKNPAMDSQIEAARFETDPAKYDAEVKSFITTAFQDVPRIPLVNDYRDVAMQKNIEGYTYWFHLVLDYRSIKRTQLSALRRSPAAQSGSRGRTFARISRIARGFMLSLEDYTSLGAAEIARRVKAGSLSPVDVVEAALSIQQRLDTSLHAFCTPTPEAAREAARALEARIRRGDEVGALAGVPVAIKDLVSTKGVRTTYGSKLYEDFIPDDDDIVVERLKAADAIILGKTNASEFGYGGFGHNPVFPTTRNPWNLSLTPGGSSAGSAAAVASRICPIAIASDGGGSIRLPAAFSGLVGIKASMGRVPVWPGCRDPRFPGVSGWELIEHIGPLARSVIDAALMLDVIAGPDSRDRLSIPDEGVGWIEAASPPPGKLGLKIAYCPDWGGVRVDRRVRALVDRAVARFETDLACMCHDREGADLAISSIASALSSRSKPTSSA